MGHAGMKDDFAEKGMIKKMLEAKSEKIAQRFSDCQWLLTEDDGGNLGVECAWVSFSGFPANAWNT